MNVLKVSYSCRRASAAMVSNTLDDLPELARQSVQNLTQRVTEEFKLPEGIDLLLEARSLAASLLPQD